MFSKNKISNRFVIVVFAGGLRDRDWDDECVGIGIFEIGIRLSSFIIDVYTGDRLVSIFVRVWADIVCILSVWGIEWSSCALVVKSLANVVRILRDWWFLSPILTDRLRSGENYIKK
jgi:hypothetical protein